MRISDKQQIYSLCISTAKDRFGKCLSKEYLSSRSKLLWQCDHGHKWKSTWHNIRAGKWCPVCSIEKRASKRRRTIEDMQKLARQKNGRCLSKVYSNTHSKLHWECSSGHQFWTIPSLVVQGYWCRTCYGDRRSADNLQKRNLKAMKVIKAKDGKFLKVDPQNRLIIHIECSHGHRWKTLASNIIYQRSWCPKCAGIARYTIEEVRHIIETKKGRCLSQEYTDSRTKLSIVCKFGHEFDMNIEAINQGSWCPTCGKAKISLRSAQFWAAKKSGKCISDFFEGGDLRKKLVRLECHMKHQWQMSLQDLRAGYWCPECTQQAFKRDRGR